MSQPKKMMIRRRALRIVQDRKHPVLLFALSNYLLVQYKSRVWTRASKSRGPQLVLGGT